MANQTFDNEPPCKHQKSGVYFGEGCAYVTGDGNGKLTFFGLRQAKEKAHRRGY